MKLTPVNKKLNNPIWDSIYPNISNKIHSSTSWEVRRKIHNEILIPSLESIQEMQRRTLRNLQNSSK